MRLGDLLPEAGAAARIAIGGLTLDSRAVRPGDAFVALRGAAHDGLDFVDAAVRRGAVAVLVEPGRELPAATVPLVAVADLGARAGALAARLHGDPSAALAVIGVTGTNGKTTCTQLLGQALTRCGRPCGVIGTLGAGFAGRLQPTAHTTPDALRLQELLAALRSEGAVAVAMEVSSHALSQARVDAVHFSTAVFTNLTHDHLDFHGSFEDYGAAKARLFSHPGLRNAVLNVDDAFGARLARNLPEGVRGIGVSVQDPWADVHARNARFLSAGIRAEVFTPWGEDELVLPLLGRFNLANALAVLAALGAEGVALPEALAALAAVVPVPGRMERVPSADGPVVIVDYAHTPDALEQTLRALRAHCGGRLWCVFGCGGDRDRSKRPLMGRIAREHADQVVVTSDNPRSEDPESIIGQICAGIPDANALRDADRRRAIHRAIAEADRPDCVLIAGKGHEDYQEVRGVRTPFSDVAVAREALAARAEARS
jgi:UDP-N-acetylmuramoyl-L-alanyl-D-glutamate--2,6-diaminopimelate ligase